MPARPGSPAAVTVGTQHAAAEVRSGTRFAFGRNWSHFLRVVNEDRIRQAEASLQERLGVADLTGRSFLDIGSGSGLFSLAARRLGARVRSLDYDADSVACTQELRRRFAADDPDWLVEEGSVLDDEAMRSLGTWDVVYAWGVLHHTGDMRRALANAGDRVASGGRLFLAIYNDQGAASRRWLAVKRAYNALPDGLRWLVLWPAALRLWGPTVVRDLCRGNPLQSWRDYPRKSLRGMSAWHDVVDWVGGLPFEVAKPEEILGFYRPRGFELLELSTCAGGLGCNEFVFGKA